MKLHTQKVALVVGLCLGGWHLAWSILVLLGIAQQLMNFVLWMHMISLPYQVTGFTLTQSVTLIIVTFAFGYIGGWVFAAVWNWLHKK